MSCVVTGSSMGRDGIPPSAQPQETSHEPREGGRLTRQTINLSPVIFLLLLLIPFLDNFLTIPLHGL